MLMFIFVQNLIMQMFIFLCKNFLKGMCEFFIKISFSKMVISLLIFHFVFLIIDFLS